MPQVLKCLLYHQETLSLLKTVILQFWNSETVPEEWNIGHLIILTKKGDLSLPKNYRGIMLLDIAYKSIAIISHSRLLPSEEWNIGHLIIIPKKGDFSLPKNYQGIMLPEITYKIIAIILH